MAISIKSALLQELNRASGSGVELVARIDERTRGKITIKTGSIYKLLHDLEHEGLIESRLGEPTPRQGGRAQTIYRFTAEGVRVAAEGSEIASLVYGEKAADAPKGQQRALEAELLHALLLWYRAGCGDNANAGNVPAKTADLRDLAESYHQFMHNLATT